MASQSFPNYYALLNVERTATTEQIRQAYKKESLRTHPDRHANATPEEKRKATERFQAVADAYYVLSDDKRRRDYDALFMSRGGGGSTDYESSTNFFSNFANMFAGGATGAGAGTSTGTAYTGAGEGFTTGERPDAEGVFGNVFEEMLRPEVTRHVNLWTYIGAAAGAALGFIIANIPGLLMGGYAGNRLGAIRDAKGKAVAQVFSELGGSQKAEILRALALKVLGSAL